MSRPRVLVCGRLPAAGRQALEAAGLQVDHLPDRGAGSLADIIEPFAGVVINSPQQVDAATIAAAPSLRVVGRAGVGVDNIDVEAATARGILVMNLPWGNTVTAAEHTIALLLAMARNVPQAAAALRAGTWDRSGYLGVEVQDKTLGVIGLGRIGREVARRAQGLQMQVVGADPFLPPGAAGDLGIELLTVAELLPRVDFLTLHVPRTDETHHLIDAAALARMKRGARIVNCARGGLVDERALLRALDSGHIAGAAFDVFEKEPTDNVALLAHPRFIGTPHLGGATEEARERVGEGIARQIADYLGSGVIRGAVNAQALGPEVQAALGPYLVLAVRLGALLAQCYSSVGELRIEAYGDVAGIDTRALTDRVLQGFFGTFLGDSVNVVNARAVAQQRGVGVTESSSTATRGYSSLLRVVAKVADGDHVVAGTVFDGGRERIVEIDGLSIEIAPAEHMLLFVNEDAPGVIGHVGSFLAQRGINIADMSLGRAPSRDRAVGALALDQPIDDAVVEALAASDLIRWARAVEL